MHQLLNPKDKSAEINLSDDLFTATGQGSIRATEPVSSNGLYYYEVVLLSPNPRSFFVGWATKECFLSQPNQFIGQDPYSIGFGVTLHEDINTYFPAVYHNANLYKVQSVLPKYRSVVGCLIDSQSKNFYFYLDGVEVNTRRLLCGQLNFSDTLYFPAISFTGHESAYFNFGQQPFKFPPLTQNFKDFYSYTFNRHLQSLISVDSEDSNLVISFDGCSARNTSFLRDCNKLAHGSMMTRPDSKGVYYYEVTLTTNGPIKIGWSALDNAFIGFDGFNRIISLDKQRQIALPGDFPQWLKDDIVGCLLNPTECQFTFSLNGHKFDSKQLGIKFFFGTEPYRPVIELGPGQSVCCNFGREPFKFPPTDLDFQDFDRNRYHDGLKMPDEDEENEDAC